MNHFMQFHNHPILCMWTLRSREVVIFPVSHSCSAGEMESESKSFSHYQVFFPPSNPILSP